MSKLEDLLVRKRTILPVLDLSKSIAQNKDEFKRLMEKVPDYKIRPIKVRAEEIIMSEQDMSFKMARREQKFLLRAGGTRRAVYTYLDPVPQEMRSILLLDMCAVPIDWKMLTTLRPKLKLEEDYFSRLIEMGKLQLKTDVRDKREYSLQSFVRKVKNKTGVTEHRAMCCAECGEEMCNGRTCIDFNYDLYLRNEILPLKIKSSAIAIGALTTTSLTEPKGLTKSKKVNRKTQPHRSGLKMKNTQPS